MIIQDQEGGQRRRAGRIILLAIVGVLLSITAVWLWPAPSPYTHLPEGQVYCGAEQVRGADFVRGGLRFDGGHTQSKAYARTGQYSSYIPPAEETRYGMGYTLEHPEPGSAYKASIWRRQTGQQNTYLAASVEGPSPRYRQENIPVTADSSGWEKLELRFSVPFGAPSERFKVYVYSSGLEAAWFDDLLIEPLPADSAFQPETLHLDIKPRHFRHLEQQRQQALRAGILETGKEDWVPASLTSNQQAGTLDAEVRLKGDWLDHISGDKWSFRVKLKGAHAWRRMRVFSLHTPKARYFLHEWLLHQLWEREDVLTTRYDFVELKLNGQSLGVYAYEEHFEKQLVESRQRREGPIMKFSEDGYWKTVRRQLSHHGYLRPGASYGAAELDSAPIEAFDDQPSEENPVIAKQIREARKLMQQYRSGQVSVERVFDLERTAHYLALCDILNAYHGITWHNQRFYYNPITARLEPVGFDGFGGPPARQYDLLGSGALNPYLDQMGGLTASLFADTAFVHHYHQALYRMSQRSYLGAALDQLATGWNARLEYLQREFPDYKPNLEDFLRNAQYVHSLLLPFDTYSLAAYSTQPHGPVQTLRLFNRHHLPIRIIGYGRNARRMSAKLDSGAVLPARLPRIYAMRLRRDSSLHDPGFLEEKAQRSQAPPLGTSIKVEAAADYLFYQVPGIDSLFATEIRPYPYPTQTVSLQELKAKAQLSPHASYRLDSGRVVFPPGEHRLSQTLVIPKGYRLVLEAGAHLQLWQGASIISYGPVRALGTAEQPIRLSAPNRDGGGLAVLQAPTPSKVDYLIAEGLGAPAYGNWSLTGAVTFYKSEVHIHNAAFLKNRSEDGVNLIRSDFSLDQCYIGEAYSDGLDADFCKGEIRNCRIEDTGNDGLDFSGSIVTIRNCQLKSNGDKGISVGEESDVTVFSTHIKDAPIALASKDLSVLRVRDIQLTDCGQGFVAFQKKPEFGPGTIIVESHTAENVGRLTKTGSGSRVMGL